MSTNESFIKAYRRDVASPATPPPASARPAPQLVAAATLAPAPIVAAPIAAAAPSLPVWHTTIEIAAANFTPATTIVASTIEELPVRRFEPPAQSAPTTSAVPAPSAPIPRPKIFAPSPVTKPLSTSPSMPLRSTPLPPTITPPATMPPVSAPTQAPLKSPPPYPPTPTPHPSTPIIGKRPLSSFQPPQLQTPPQLQALQQSRPRTATAPPRTTIFTPETIISAFRWPSVCRTLWEEYAVEYEHVAEKLVDTSRAGRPIIGVTGINAGDGCTTSLLCLAVALAARKLRIALVDASFCDPQLAELLGAKVNTSWSTVLDRGLPVAEAMIRATEDKIDLLPLDGDHRLAGHEAADLVAGMQTAVTAGVLRSSYDIVLVDLGALLAPGAYAALSNLLRLMPIQSALVVTNPRTADGDDAAVVGELLEEDGCELLGVIENRARPLATRSFAL